MIITPPAKKSAMLKRLPAFVRNSLIHPQLLILFSAIFLVITANLSFYQQVLAIYPFAHNIGFIVSLTGLLFGLMWLILQLLCYRPTIKVVLIAMVLVAAVCGYFTDAYGTIFDSNMLVNTLQTDHAEAMDLLAPGFIIRLLLLGILPAFIIAKLRLKPLTLKQTVVQKIAALLLALAVIAVSLLPFGDQYASFFRQHKAVRYYVNPITPIYSAIKLGTDTIHDWRRPEGMIAHATDAKRLVATSSNADATVDSKTDTNASATTASKPKLMVFVVGETARADHIGLNGYARDTTPLLAKQQDIYSFKDVQSCGTSTAYSVPCMFSYMDRDSYDMDAAEYNENVLDTLSKQGVNVIWRDNNSSSKGVADRVTYEDYKSDKLNPECDEECRDIGMLAGLDKVIKAPKDTLLVLHQMGNHGPAYYKRYPKAFEVFKPVCMSSELSKCDQQSVINGYDNAIRYTDYFLNSVIETLKTYQKDYDVVMVYVSDHGESLGENNVYLHGLPYSVAPRAQKQVPAIIWSPRDNHIDANSMANQLQQPVSHDYITPTLLQFFNITTQETAGKPTFFKVQ